MWHLQIRASTLICESIHIHWNYDCARDLLTWRDLSPCYKALCFLSRLMHYPKLLWAAGPEHSVDIFNVLGEYILPEWQPKTTPCAQVQPGVSLIVHSHGHRWKEHIWTPSIHGCTWLIHRSHTHRAPTWTHSTKPLSCSPLWLSRRESHYLII